ncbi:MAG: hypothetical protein ACRDTF_07550 [Pseudonocardiaceae bacterium]
MLTKRFLVTVLAGAIMVGSTVAAYAAIAPAATGRGSQLVTPQQGMLNVRPIPWREVKKQGRQTVRVFFTTGVEPCYVLTDVTVDYRADKVLITLHEGSDPTAEGQACLMITVQKAVDVTLAEPLGNRAIIDGSTQG